MAGPSPRWGWHQLQPPWASRLVTEAALPRGALVLDIGAGLGALTEPLLRAGARVIAVEAHAGRARTLRERFGAAAVVVEADAADLRLPRRPYHVVANLPFGITTAVLRRLLQPGSRLRSAHIVLQQPAAVRWASTAAPGHPRWGRAFTARLGCAVPASAFRPVAPVACRVLVIRRREWETAPL